MLKADAQGDSTRRRILDAAFDSLREDGYARTSARSIARRGGFNQALVFYHFGSVADLLLAALDRASEARRARYEEVLPSATTPASFAREARRLYAEDVESGHATVLAELLGAASGDADLRRQMAARVGPWLDFTAGLVDRFLAGSPLASLVDPRAAAGAVLALYVGMDLLGHLEADAVHPGAIFDAGDRLAALAAGLLGGESE